MGRCPRRRAQPCDSQTLLQLRLSQPSVVVQAIGQVDVLLHLSQHQAGADGMDGACWYVNHIAGPNLPNV